MPPLCWRHHTLIQALLSLGPLMEKEFQAIFSDVTGKSVDSHQHLLKEYLGRMNRELSYVQLELRASCNQYDGVVYYGVINTVADEQSKLGATYTVPQIAFYKGIGDSTQIHPAFRNFSMSQKDKTIQEFIQDQWLSATPDGKIGFGVRSFLDLRSWFHNNEVPPCDVCNEAGIKADLCPNETCTIRIHDYCLKAKFSHRNKLCPGCKTPWPYVAPKADAVEEEDTEPRSHPSTRKRLRTRNVEEAESNGQQASQPSARKKAPPSSDDGAGPFQQTRRATRTSSRFHG